MRKRLAALDVTTDDDDADLCPERGYLARLNVIHSDICFFDAMSRYRYTEDERIGFRMGAIEMYCEFLDYDKYVMLFECFPTNACLESWYVESFKADITTPTKR